MKNKKALLTISGKILYIILFVISYIFQFLVFPRLGIGIPVFLLIPLTTAVAMYEREFSGMLFGLLAGALWDLASPLPDGSLAFIFTVVACFTGLLLHYVLRNTLLTALLLSLTFTLIYYVFYFLFSKIGFDYEFIRSVIITHFLPSALLSAVITIPDYFIVRGISRLTQTDKI